ncbi:MAG: class I adenylate cyclase [Gammaproteobacteria bacterium]
MIKKKSHYPPITLGSPGEEISKKDLHAVSQRFKNLHQLRLQRIQDFLYPRQRVFLDLLPLIFHINHPLLPGFVSTETPAGIPDYTPKQNSIKAARKFSKTFAFQRRALINYPIYGLFLMGSVSSIAFSKTSDMDIWLCHQPNLPPDEIEKLQLKANEIEKWALSLDLEVHIFLINSGQYLKGEDVPLSAESSGATQHYLLLEEFYRTAIFLAGRIPVWWIVPPHEEKRYNDYVRHLKQKRFVSANEIIDFGGFESVPAEEFISATLWHLYKSIESPYKSLLKLMLMECYASEYPEPEWLCLTLKKSIYAGDFNLDDLDPYLQIYQKIEKYLSSPLHNDRLELARQCLYLKIMGASNPTQDSPIKIQRGIFLQNVAAKWNWPPETFARFVERKNWNILNAAREHKTIMRQLNHCHRMISGFAGEHIEKNDLENEDIKLIGRKLYSFLEKKPGKIELITTRSTIRIKEKELSVLEIPFAVNHGWALYLGRVTQESHENFKPIKKTWSLLELLSWLVINNFYQRKAQIHFEAFSLDIPSSSLLAIMNDLRTFLNKNLAQGTKDLETYKKPNKLARSLAFVNLGLDIGGQSDGTLLISERSDVLSYGAQRRNFVQTIDRLSISSWGEVITQKYENLEGLFSLLTEIFNTHQPVSNSSLEVFCYSSARAASIAIRIKRMFIRLVELFAASPGEPMPRFIVPGEAIHYVFQYRDGRLTCRPLQDEPALLAEFGKPQKSYSPVYLDEEALKTSPLSAVFPLNRPRTIQFFYESKGGGVEIMVLDERGALFMQHHGDSTPFQILTSYRIFLERLRFRSLAEPELGIEYYAIMKNSQGQPFCHRIEPEPFDVSQFLEIRIAAKEISPNRIIYTIYCDDAEFSTMELGEKVFKKAAEHIIQQRKNRENYPIYITDVDVPLSVLGLDCLEELQTVHFLQHKKKIEDRLNNAG